jgi:cytochrome c553
MNRFQRLTLILLSLSLIACEGGRPSQTRQSSDEPVRTETHRFDRVSPDPVAHGQRLSAVLGCLGCHTPDYTGEDWSDPQLGVLWTANLTHSAAKFTEHELAVMITRGTRPDRALLDMPSYLFTHLHPEDLSALIHFLKSLPVTGDKHPEPTIGPQLEAEINAGTFKDSAQKVNEMEQLAPPDLGEQHALARHLLRATCAECHGMDLAGSAEALSDAPPRPGLSLVAAYSEAEFFTLMRTGKALGDRDLKLMSGVARWRYSQLTDQEIKAIYAYLLKLAEQQAG